VGIAVSEIVDVFAGSTLLLLFGSDDMEAPYFFIQSDRHLERGAACEQSFLLKSFQTSS